VSAYLCELKDRIVNSFSWMHGRWRIFTNEIREMAGAWMGSEALNRESKSVNIGSKNRLARD
jgi:hypothetical protein